MFRSDGGRLIFQGKAGDDVLPALAAMHNITQKQGYRDVTLDFAGVTKFDAKFMIPLVTTCRSYRSSQIDFEIILPDDGTQSRLFINTNWAHIIKPEKYDANSKRGTNHLSAIIYSNGDEHFKAVDECMDVMLRNISGLNRSKLKALEWSLNEITDNVLNHSESSVGGIVQVMTRPTSHMVDFYVCDSGIGIPKSLRSTRSDITDDSSALRAAINEGVTRNSKTNQGNGLFGTFKCCEVSSGQFDILSGYVRLHHEPGITNVTKNAIPFHGTFVRASINYDFDQLLEKALIFKGKPHDPGYDYVERIYMSSDTEVDFHLEREVNYFGSREAGRKARNKLNNLLDDRKNIIVFDFEGVDLISSSFADEVFGKLFEEYGPISFSQLFKFKNVDITVKKLIDRSISQRMKL
ncbi:MAG: hypothetical protein C0490_24290 [Marivirga sp.]|nr:hypothetical protein [Marivirga sp.]